MILFPADMDDPKLRWLELGRGALLRLADIPLREMMKAADLQEMRRFRKDEFFLRAGDKPDKVAFIVSGLFRVFFVTENGDDRTLAFRGEGKFISALDSFNEDKPSWLSIQALEDSVASCVAVGDYRRLLDGNPCWIGLSAKYRELLCNEKQERERELLSDDAATRYRRLLERHPGIEARIRHYHIASYLGITPVALSRIRKTGKSSGSST